MTNLKAKAASAVSMDILIVIDTEYIKQNFGVSKDKNHPVGISHDHQYMLCTGSRGINGGQGTGDLSFKAIVGDYVSFRGVSIYQNSDDAVIIYAITKFSGVEVFNQFNANSLTRTKAVQPDPKSISRDGLPALNVPQNFLSLDSRVGASGTEGFMVTFALYTLASDGQTQDLYGYYTWDPTITVS